MDELAVRPGPPGASYTVTVRVTAHPHPALLPRLGQAVSSVGAVVVGMDLVEVAAAGTTVDLTLQAASEEHVAAVTAALERADCRVRHVSDRTFLYHLGGKIEVTPRVAVRTRQDLSLAYTPGVGRVASAIARRPSDAWALTAKGTSVAIATDGSAVLGLGALGPLAALPVMEGKALLSSISAGSTPTPSAWTPPPPRRWSTRSRPSPPASAASTWRTSPPRPASGSRPNCSAGWTSRSSMTTSTARRPSSLAAVLNGCRMTGRDLSGVRAVLVGVGAAGTAVAEALLDAGVGDLVAFDVDGVLSAGPGAPPHHARLAARSNPPGRQDASDGAGRGRPVHRHVPARVGRPGHAGGHGAPAPGLRPGQPRARGLRRGAGRRGGRGHRPQRFPQPDQQLAVFPRLFQGRPGRPGRRT